MMTVFGDHIVLWTVLLAFTWLGCHYAFGPFFPDGDDEDQIPNTRIGDDS